MNDEVRIIKNSLLSYASRGVAAMVGIALVPYLLQNYLYSGNPLIPSRTERNYW